MQKTEDELEKLLNDYGRYFKSKEFEKAALLVREGIDTYGNHKYLFYKMIDAYYKSSNWKMVLESAEELLFNYPKESLSKDMVRSFIHYTAENGLPDIDIEKYLNSEYLAQILREYYNIRTDIYNGYKDNITLPFSKHIEHYGFNQNSFAQAVILLRDDYKEEFENYIKHNILNFSFDFICLIYFSVRRIFFRDILFLNYKDIDNSLLNTQQLFTKYILLYINSVLPYESIHDIKVDNNKVFINGKELNLSKAMKYYLDNCNKKAKINSIKPVKKRDTAPKVALLLTGQMRGYKKALKTQIDTIIKDLNPDIYIDTWQEIGYREPILGHAHRVFSGNFLTAYKKVLQEVGYADIKRLYKPLFELLESESKISEAELYKIYKAKYISIEDEKTPPIDSFNNMQKMYYKLYNCFEATSSKRYDYYIRLRPDKTIEYKNPINWDDIFYRIDNENTIFTDAKPNLHHVVKFVVGDQFAIGNYEQMKIYTSVWKEAKRLSEEFLPGGYPLKPHTNIAYQLWLNCIKVDTIKGVEFPSLENITLSSKEIYSLIGELLHKRDNKYDKILLSAILKDLK